MVGQTRDFFFFDINAFILIGSVKMFFLLLDFVSN